ncbi:hypothetical protein UPYG_G00164780 [Umbra pygmaea]|uniref:Large ribosomal subunit protein mL46 n=1 Tax=Umbra pygmaea TaxID=75934 RepID=A0ABD0XA54_UMBPY
MAAPCSRIMNRPLWQIILNVSWSVQKQTGVRQLSRSNACHAAVQTKGQTKHGASPWKLHGAVCVQRLPVLSQDRNPIEDQFAELMHQMELERSVLSEHEQKLLEDADRMRRKQADDYDSDEEADYGDQETITAQDQEDAWEQRFRRFHLAPRASGVDGDQRSVERCLANSLVLLTQQTVGENQVWLLPQAQWEAGETLRQTAERALRSLPEADFNATFLGNTPCGFYKYKFPKATRTESCVGVKVFFFKALLLGNPSANQNRTFLWLKKAELPDYLKPEYLEKVNQFVLDL